MITLSLTNDFSITVPILESTAKTPNPTWLRPPPPWFDGRLPYGAGGKRRVVYRVGNVYRGRGEGRGFESCRGSVVAARRSSDYHAPPNGGLG